VEHSAFLFFIFFWVVSGGTQFTCYVSHYLAYCTSPGWCIWFSRWNEDWQGKPEYSKKTCPSVTLPSTNPTWPDLGPNPGRGGGKPATNRLRYGTAIVPSLAVRTGAEEINVTAEIGLGCRVLPARVSQHPKAPQMKKVYLFNNLNAVFYYQTHLQQ
jgi:hypothetical protein